MDIKLVSFTIPVKLFTRIGIIFLITVSSDLLPRASANPIKNEKIIDDIEISMESNNPPQ